MHKCFYQFKLLLSRHICTESYIHRMFGGSDARSPFLMHTLTFPAAPSFGTGTKIPLFTESLRLNYFKRDIARQDIEK